MLNYEWLIVDSFYERNIVKENSLAFAVKVLNCYKCLCVAKNEYVLSKQLLRSGTSVGAMVR